jgi:lipid II:glycine glycyltransferase (peptidoglycan interpeptide bridge formation enzyme)
MNYATFERQVLALGDRVRVLVANHEGAPQSAAVIPFSHHSAYYMHGGNVASPLTGTSNLLQWEAIRMFRELGVHRYDFFGARTAPKEGSKAEGIMKFKARFGGDYTRGYMWKYSFRPVKCGLYNVAARLRSGGDVVDQERHKLAFA